MLIRMNFSVCQVLWTSAQNCRSTFIAFHLLGIAHKTLDAFFIDPLRAKQVILDNFRLSYLGMTWVIGCMSECIAFSTVPFSLTFTKSTKHSRGHMVILAEKN